MLTNHDRNLPPDISNLDYFEPDKLEIIKSLTDSWRQSILALPAQIHACVNCAQTTPGRLNDHKNSEKLMIKISVFLFNYIMVLHLLYYDIITLTYDVQ